MRIIIIRPSAIGDVVMASPLLAAIKRAWPGAKVSWVIEPHLAELIRHHPDLDEVIVWPKGKWLALLKSGRFATLFKAIKDFSQPLKDRGYDLALETTGLLRGRLLAYLSGARERIGFGSKEPGDFLMTKIISRGPQNHRMGSEYFYLLKALGIDPGPFRPSIHIPKGAKERVGETLAAFGLKDNFVLFCPFTTRPQKHWFFERWQDLAEGIKRRFSLPVVILGGPGERRLARELPAWVVNLVGEMSLIESAAVVARARVVIGVDTGLTHMGVALRRPTIALFGATRPYLEPPSSEVRIVYKPRPCSPCRRKVTCGHQYLCMRDIQVEEILSLVAEFLKGHEVEA
ncbi:glycosyltransferase family 9 protein [Thermosulfuriphilus sp.]